MSFGFACMTALASVVGCGTRMSPEQQAAMSNIRAAGGRVFYESGGYRVDLHACPIEDTDLEQLQYIPNLKTVDVSGTLVTDESLPHWEKLKTLKSIQIERTAMTPEGVAALQKALPDADIRY
jgi:hypothetical protein